MAMKKRCLCEQKEERRDKINTGAAKPLRAMIQGLPGAGKTKLIDWVRFFFENGMGHTHGVDFICLASQNTMAAFIKGRTFHSWAGLKVNTAATRRAKQQAFSTPDAKQMYERCRALRWVLIEEGSTASAEVLAGVHGAVCSGVRERHT